MGLREIVDWFLPGVRRLSIGEAYWQEVEAVLPYLDAADRPRLLASAEQANLGERWVTRLRNTRCVVKRATSTCCR